MYIQHLSTHLSLSLHQFKSNEDETRYSIRFESKQASENQAHIEHNLILLLHTQSKRPLHPTLTPPRSPIKDTNTNQRKQQRLELSTHACRREKSMTLSSNQEEEEHFDIITFFRISPFPPPKADMDGEKTVGKRRRKRTTAIYRQEKNTETYTKKSTPRRHLFLGSGSSQTIGLNYTT
jgi:hypothetical protein